ncbi:MAG TPA: hypothetical protein PK431_16485 [Chitinophagales bacterium]|nr:hypothetical protein [Chitinophagales bacterium]
MQSIYLIKVWKESKALFIGIFIFIFFQFFFIAKRIQNFPFFIFDMYSRPIEKPSTFTIYEIKANGKSVDYTSFKNTQENTILNTIQTYETTEKVFPKSIYETVIEQRFKNKISSSNYQFIKNGLSNNKAAIDEFDNWLNRYCIQSNGFSVYKNTYNFQTKQQIDSILILSEDAI